MSLFSTGRFLWRWPCLLSVLAWSCGTVLAQGDSGSEPDRLVLLDGETRGVTIEAIDTEGNVRLRGEEHAVPLAGLRRIERPSPDSGATPKEDKPPSVTLELAGGGRIRATNVSLADELCRATWTYGELRLSIEYLRGVRFDPEPDRAFDEAISAETDDDIFLIKVDNRIEPVRGFVESIDAEDVTFEFRGETRTMPRASLHGVVLANFGEQPDLTGKCLVALRSDPSRFGERESPERLWGRVQSLSDGELKLEIAQGQAVALPWDRVLRLTVRSDRLVFLSDLKPVRAAHTPVLLLPKDWRRDRSVGGQTLSVGGRQFERGLGVAARTVLVYRADGKFDRFSAYIGLDDETQGRGNCVFVVRGDGRELAREKMSGGEKPRKLDVDIRGVEEVELIVEPGKDYDLADHADWCDACFLREPRS